MQETIKDQIKESIAVKEALLKDASLVEKMERAAVLMIACLKNGGTIAFCGNGGSAADAQHLAAEFVGRYQKERAGWAAIALNVNTSILTAIGNDYGFDRVFSRQVEALLSKNDILVGISTSGNSKNILEAFKTAKTKGVTCIALTGQGGGAMADDCELLLDVPARNTPRIQESHIMIGHIICSLVETTLVNDHQPR